MLRRASRTVLTVTAVRHCVIASRSPSQSAAAALATAALVRACRCGRRPAPVGDRRQHGLQPHAREHHGGARGRRSTWSFQGDTAHDHVEPGLLGQRHRGRRRVVRPGVRPRPARSPTTAPSTRMMRGSVAGARSGRPALAEHGWTLRWSTQEGQRPDHVRRPDSGAGSGKWTPRSRRDTAAATVTFNPARAGSYQVRARTVNGAKRSGLVTGWLQSPFLSQIAVIDLRTDTLTRPTEAMRAAMARRRGRRRRLRRGPDRPRARGAGRRAVRPRGGAVHADRLDGQRARGRLAGRARPGGAVRGARAHRPRRARRARRVRRAHDAHLDRTRAGRSTWRRSGRCSPPTWARSSCRTAAISVENTHNFAGGAVLPLDDLRDLRECGHRGRRRRPPRRRPDLERPRRDRRPARGVRRGRRRAVGLPVQGARRPGRLADGRRRATRSPRPGCGASGWAAGCARSASSPRPGCTPSTTTSSGSPTTTPTPGCSPRPAASTRRRVDTNIVVVDRSDAAAFVAAAARGRASGRRGRPDRGPAGHPPRRHPRRRRAGRGGPARCDLRRLDGLRHPEDDKQ